MAFRRRRRRRGLWLPVLGHNLAQEPGAFFESSFNRVIDVGPNRDDLFDVQVGVTFDFGAQATVGSVNVPTLSQFIGGGYALRRIVGKVHLIHLTEGNRPDPAVTFPSSARIGCAWMVRRVDDAGNAIAAAAETNTLLAENIQDPWIWRQTWILGGGFDAFRYDPTFPVAADDPAATQDFPNNNVFDGSAKNGPFFDIKTRRTVANEERLFFEISSKGMPLDADYDQASRVYCHVDFRIFAFPIRVMGNRGNASR